MNNGSILKFVKSIMLSGFLCAILAIFLLNFGILTIKPLFIFFPLVLFICLGILLNFQLIKSLDSRPQKFINLFLGGLTLKMFVHILVLIAIDFMYPQIAVEFTLVYAFYYLVFTVTEIVLLSSFSRKQV